MISLYVVWVVVGFILTAMLMFNENKNAFSPIPDIVILLTSVLLGWFIGVFVFIWFLSKMVKKVLLPLSNFFVGMTK